MCSLVKLELVMESEYVTQQGDIGDKIYLVDDGLLYVYQEAFEKKLPSAKKINRRQRQRSMVIVADPWLTPTTALKND